MTFDESKVRRDQGKFANKDASRDEADIDLHDDEDWEIRSVSNINDYRKAVKMMALSQTMLETQYDVNITVAEDVCREVLGSDYMKYRSTTGILGNWADAGAAIEFNLVDITVNGHIVPDFMFANRFAAEASVRSMAENFKASETKKNTTYIQNLIKRYKSGQASLVQTKAYMQGLVDDRALGYESAKRWLNTL